MSADLVLKPGLRLMSAVCTTEVVVVRADDPSAVIECGGAPMRPIGTPRSSAAQPASGLDAGSILGKRYGEETSPVEVLCVKAGVGSVSVNGEILTNRVAKPLPSSD